MRVKKEGAETRTRGRAEGLQKAATGGRQGRQGRTGECGVGAEPEAQVGVVSNYKGGDVVVAPKSSRRGEGRARARGEDEEGWTSRGQQSGEVMCSWFFAQARPLTFFSVKKKVRFFSFFFFVGSILAFFQKKWFRLFLEFLHF